MNSEGLLRRVRLTAHLTLNKCLARTRLEFITATRTFATQQAYLSECNQSGRTSLQTRCIHSSNLRVIKRLDITTSRTFLVLVLVLALCASTSHIYASTVQEFVLCMQSYTKRIANIHMGIDVYFRYTTRRTGGRAGVDDFLLDDKYVP